MCSHYFEILKYSLQRLLNTLRFPCFLGISRPLRVHLSQSHSLHDVDGRERLFLWLKNPLEGKRSLPCLNLTTQLLKRLINLFLDGRNSYRINFSRDSSSWANWRAFQSLRVSCQYQTRGCLFGVFHHSITNSAFPSFIRVRGSRWYSRRLPLNQSIIQALLS